MKLRASQGHSVSAHRGKMACLIASLFFSQSIHGRISSRTLSSESKMERSSFGMSSCHEGPVAGPDPGPGLAPGLRTCRACSRALPLSRSSKLQPPTQGTGFQPALGSLRVPAAVPQVAPQQRLHRILDPNSSRTCVH